MGEKSKNIGEKGEKIVGGFLKLIGWEPHQKGTPIDCHREKHDTATHGIDYSFTYKCPLHIETLEHVLMSVKYSDDPYPISSKTDYKGLKTVFKEHLTDIAHTVECFKKSSVRAEINKHHKGVKKSKETGVLFWLNDNDANINTGIIAELSKTRIDRSLIFDTVHLIDNKRINELQTSLLFVKNHYGESATITFDYFSTGHNISLNDRITNGKIMPVQYLSSPIIPLRAEIDDSEKVLNLISFDDFSINGLKRILNLAHNYVLSYQMKTVIIFPNFNPTQVIENEISAIKAGFKENDFAQNIEILSFKPNHRNL